MLMLGQSELGGSVHYIIGRGRWLGVQCDALMSGEVM